MLHVIHEDTKASLIKDLLHTLDTKQIFFIERACRLERTARQQDTFSQWQSFLAAELPNYSPKK